MPAKNAFRPAGLSYRSYGWVGAPAYTSSDIPVTWWRNTSRVNRDVYEQQFAYEWLNFGERGGGTFNRSNPPFRTGSAGQLLPQQQGQRILRGFIRRAEYEVGDPVSKTRLYFMYNPEQISRDYVSYLDQGALDPFNTVFESGNLVAPPSFMDFSFELFFDRQDEAQSPQHPGVFVDYEYFDLVVRNVVPDPNHRRNKSLPDNGVMMVNPRDITVVFSPQLTVQGRPLNARVVFEKFTHRMVPTRMRIALTMRVVYLGPIKEMAEYKQEEFTTSATIPWGRIKANDFDITYDKLELKLTGLEDLLTEGQNEYLGGAGEFGGSSNIEARNHALDLAIRNVEANGTTYDVGGRSNLWAEADCSSLVCGAYRDSGLGDAMGWSSLPSSWAMVDAIEAKNWTNASKVWSGDGKWPADWAHLMARGDVLIRDTGGDGGHVGFFAGRSGDGFSIFHAGSESMGVGFSNYSSSQVGGITQYNIGIRPMPIAADAATSQAGRGPR